MRPNFFSNYYLLTRTFTFIQKRLERKVMQRLAATVPGGQILDVGCGYQPYRCLFDNRRYVGLDLSLERCPTVVGDARFLPFMDGSFDGIICSEVIEHVFEKEKVLDEIRRVLRPGGWIILTAPMSWGLHYEPYDFWRFTPYSLRRLLEDRGFQVVRTEKVGGLFSLIGSRFVEGVSLEIWRKLKWLPRRLRHSIILLFSIPTSLMFALIGDLFDRFISTDAIGYAVQAVKGNDAGSC
jgi:SAM-dependent methyltransferase